MAVKGETEFRPGFSAQKWQLASMPPAARLATGAAFFCVSTILQLFFAVFFAENPFKTGDCKCIQHGFRCFGQLVY